MNTRALETTRNLKTVQEVATNSSKTRSGLNQKHTKGEKHEKNIVTHVTFQELSVLSVSCFALLFQSLNASTFRFLGMLCKPRVVWKHTEDVGTLELKELHVARPAVRRTGN